jgi:hypothetical protein
MKSNFPKQVRLARALQAPVVESPTAEPPGGRRSSFELPRSAAPPDRRLVALGYLAVMGLPFAKAPASG